MLERNVVELARPSLDALAASSGETINLAVPAHNGVEHVAQVDSRHFLGAGQWLGRVVDYHCTAVGKVFMAFGRAPMPTAPMAKHAPATITDPRRLRAELQGRRAHRLRDRGRRARARPGGDRGAGPRRSGRRRRRAQHHRTDVADDAGADPRAATDSDRRGAGHRAGASATASKELTPHDPRGDPATAVRRDPCRQRAGGQGRRQRGAGDRARARADAVRRADPVAGGGRRPLRARRLLRARDADRGARDAGRARHPAPAARRDRHAAGRDVPDGHGQGRRPRHRQEPLQHHARGRGLHRDRPRRQRAAREVHRADRASTTRTSSASRRS